MLKLNIIQPKVYTLFQMKSPMKVKVVIPLDLKGQKIVNQYRFQYDRPLLKLCEASVELIPSVQTFMNLKILKEQLSPILQGFKRFKVYFNAVEYGLNESSSLFFSMEESKHFTALKQQLSKLSIFEELGQGDWCPHIPFCRVNDVEEAETIYGEVTERPIRHDFFASQINLIMKDKEDVWEIVGEYPL